MAAAGTFSYRIDLRGVAAVVGKLTPALWRPAIQELVTDATLLAEREAKQRAPRDTAALARSITSEVHPLAGRVYSTLSYAAVAELGRRPGGRPPPPDALRGWIARHNYAGTPWQLARSIARRGIKGRFFMKAARQAVVRALPGLSKRAADRIVATWGAS